MALSPPDDDSPPEPAAAALDEPEPPEEWVMPSMTLSVVFIPEPAWPATVQMTS